MDLTPESVDDAVEATKNIDVTKVNAETLEVVSQLVTKLAEIEGINDTQRENIFGVVDMLLK